MASSTPSQSHFGQPKRTSFSGYPGNASIFLEKAKAGNRGSTPDSEALASSDDEQEHHYRLHSITNLPGTRPVRRPSWLTDTQQPPQRKASLSGAVTFPPNASHPASPANEQIPWAAAAAPNASMASATGRGHSASGSIPWGSAIWSSDTQKGPPSRLMEVLPSPTTMVPPPSAGSLVEEPLLSPTYSRENHVDSAIPFPIPLHPTLKTYRSQSYSVGQLDPESANVIPTPQGGHSSSGRSRSGVSYTGLQHRPSRPSMLGDIPHDASLLGQLREVDDDDEDSASSEAGVQLSAHTHARTIDQLARENAMLRQAAAESLDNARDRSRTGTAENQIKSSRHPASPHQRFHENAQEESTYGYADRTSTRIGHSFSNEGLRARRSSEYAAKPSTPHAMAGIPEHRNLESFKKGHWQSSLGFGGIPEPPQSRRHSFAEVPTRQTSISSSGEPSTGTKAEHGSRPNTGHAVPLGYMEGMVRPSQGDDGEHIRFHLRPNPKEVRLRLEHLRDRDFAAVYFSGIDPSIRTGNPHGASMSPVPAYQMYSPSNAFGRPAHLASAYPRTSQLLYVVTFKACRAEVFYVAEGTGLEVKPGDLVIVEADRGTDLGTVLHDNCSWAQAREMRDHCTEEHYKWLMMFSRHGQNGANTPNGMNGQHISTTSPHGSALGSSAASAGQSSVQESLNGDLKPKMIKRLAQTHEVQTLREKEGNEAKAKRVCQQKVIEHRLNMEILDAEFQMSVPSTRATVPRYWLTFASRDWKKLTFYYFADAYINFNPLVTDLFKIYKTRIWMSAINPASFATATTPLPLQMPSGLGPGAFPTDAGAGLRQYRAAPTLNSASASQGVYRDTGRAWDSEGSNVSPMAMPGTYSQSIPAADFDTRPFDQYSSEYLAGNQQLIGLQPRYNPAMYNISNLSNPLHVASLKTTDDAAKTSNGVSAEWGHAFHGLSLGS
ncbi:MAG: hypothetical protein Q9222_002464 [Ikaeria aurantiellina]